MFVRTLYLHANGLLLGIDCANCLLLSICLHVYVLSVYVNVVYMH